MVEIGYKNSGFDGVKHCNVIWMFTLCVMNDTIYGNMNSASLGIFDIFLVI